jgi:hypothetical protein
VAGSVVTAALTGAFYHPQAGLSASPTEALLHIEAEAARALGETGAVVRALGDDRPYASELARLATPALAGPPVHPAIDGNLDNLPPAVGAALFRLAQVAVTNARRPPGTRPASRSGSPPTTPRNAPSSWAASSPPAPTPTAAGA